MSKLNYNRPILRKIDDRNKQKTTLQKAIDSKQALPNYKSNRMNFGKYKGYKFADIPDSYLEWIIKVTTDNKLALLYAKELAKRPSYLRKHNI